MAGRVGTIEDIAWRGHRLRLWCFGCERSRTLDEGKVLQMFADRGWPLDLDAARRRFPCGRCRSFAEVMILPASQLAPLPPPEPERELSWADEVARFFHANRAKRKERPLPTATRDRLQTRPRPPSNAIDDLS